MSMSNFYITFMAIMLKVNDVKHVLQHDKELCGLDAWWLYIEMREAEISRNWIWE